MNWLYSSAHWKTFAGWVQDIFGISPEMLAKLLTTAVLIAIFALLSRLLRRVLLARIDELSLRYRASKVLKTLLGVALALWLIRIWLAGLNLATYFGILSAGLAIALKDPLVNMAGWIFLRVRRPFEVGDRIQIGTHSGDVVDIRLFSFAMLEVGNWVHADQSTGRIIHMPNGRIFYEALANYTEGFDHIWNEIPITVTFESDYQRAHEILTEIVAREASRAKDVAEQVRHLADHYQVSFRYLTPIVWLEVADIGVLLTMRYLCHARQRRSSADRIWRRVLEAFGPEDGIDFAYPTQRFFDHMQEGKPAVAGRAGKAGAASLASKGSEDD